MRLLNTGLGVGILLLVLSSSARSQFSQLHPSPSNIQSNPQQAVVSPSHAFGTWSNHSSAEMVRGVNHEVAQLPYQQSTSSSGYNDYQGSAHIGAAGCSECAPSENGLNRPYSVRVDIPTQPVGVTSGACQPCIHGIDCSQCPPGEKRWSNANSIDFQPLYHGEFIGPVRLAALLEYRIRVNDELTFTFIPNRDRVNEEYRLMVGDVISIKSPSDDSIGREKIQVQPDGKIHVPILTSPVEAYGKTLLQLRTELEAAYRKYIVSPAIIVEPVVVNTALADLLDSVNGPFAAGGRAFLTSVNPDGRIQLPRLGSVYVLGMTLDEIRREVNLRYTEKVTGIEVEPRLTRTAQRFFHVFGEVANPGQFEMKGPTSVTAGLAQAGGLKLGANSRQVVVFRRAEDWRLVSTILDIRGGHLGKRPNPSDEIWLRDSDLIIVPPKPIKLANDALEQFFTNGLYRAVPFQGVSIQRNQ